MDDHKLQMLHSSGACDWRTPPEMLEKLKQTFPIEIDLAAKADNAVVEVEESVIYLGPDHPNPAFRDALAVAWHTIAKWGFLNPTYSLSLYSDGLKAGIDRKDLQWLLIESWANKAYYESLKGFHTIGVFPYAPQTEWFRHFVMGHLSAPNGVDWAGHAALDYWKMPHRVSFLQPDGSPSNNANVNTCIIHWGPNPGFVGPWVPSGRYWSYR